MKGVSPPKYDVDERFRLADTITRSRIGNNSSQKITNTTAHQTKKRGIISAIESLTETTLRFHVILSNIRGKGSFDKR